MLRKVLSSTRRKLPLGVGSGFRYHLWVELSVSEVEASNVAGNLVPRGPVRTQLRAEWLHANWRCFPEDCHLAAPKVALRLSPFPP